LGIAVGAAFNLLVGTLTGGLMLSILQKPPEATVGFFWAVAGAMNSASQVVVGVTALAFLFWRRSTNLGRSVVSAKVSAAACLLLALIGAAAVPEAYDRGGVWGGLHPIFYWVCCVGIPAYFSAIQLAMIVGLKRLARICALTVVDSK